MSGAVPPNAAADPSMEDILASIRRILNEDEAAPKGAADPEPPLPPHIALVPPIAVPPPAPVHVAAAEPDDDDTLELQMDMLVSEEPEPELAEDEFDPPPLPVYTPPEPAPSWDTPREARIEPLVAPETVAVASSSIASLMSTLAIERSQPVYRGGPTIEDLVREEIRPLLKQWLDTYLPPLVERLVRTEIERVINRATP